MKTNDSNFSLSEHRCENTDRCYPSPEYMEEDVKEFIRLLKEEIHKRDLDNFMGHCYSIKDIQEKRGIPLKKWIDKISGDKLV